MLAPHSRQDIIATFKPKQEKGINYNVVCNVKHKPTKLVRVQDAVVVVIQAGGP